MNFELFRKLHVFNPFYDGFEVSARPSFFKSDLPCFYIGHSAFWLSPSCFFWVGPSMFWPNHFRGSFWAGPFVFRLIPSRFFESHFSIWNQFFPFIESILPFFESDLPCFDPVLFLFWVEPSLSCFSPSYLFSKSFSFLKLRTKLNALLGWR